MSGDRERLALLGHELRSPVAALAAVSEALADETLDTSARRRLLGLAVRACAAIDRLASDASVTSITPRTTDVLGLVEEAAASAALRGTRTVRITSQLSTLTLEADPLRVRQALDNLVANAMSFSPPGEDVVIHVATRDGLALISVVDVGPGIPAGDQERVFQLGIRLDDQRPGSGIGLAVSRAIAEAHGGTLTVESTAGSGAAFTLALPLSSPSS
ncbi:MAG: HAMP domain-containing sensor histidine kinase [Gaiellaceae bacterium]